MLSGRERGSFSNFGFLFFVRHFCFSTVYTCTMYSGSCSCVILSCKCKCIRHSLVEQIAGRACVCVLMCNPCAA